jgi:NitT/TauT family transport system substrate-binding protein
MTALKPVVMRALLAVAAVAAVESSGVRPASALDEFRFGLSWQADGDRGGYYQGLAAGIYKKYNLDLTIVPGGPQINNPQLLAAGKLDGVLLNSSIDAFNYASNDIPLVSVGAVFQKHPQILLAHKSQGYKSIAEMKGKPIMVASLQRNGFWRWLNAKYGFTDDQLRPYSFSYGMFMSDQKAIQQGFITWDPLAVRLAGGDPATFLLADEGFNEYHALLTVRRETLATKRDLVQRFVDATIESWYSYLYGDPSPAVALIKECNPSMTDELILFSRQSQLESGIIDSGDAKTLGIGALNEARSRAWFAELTKAGIVPAGDYWKSAFDTSLVNKRVGMSK